MGVEVRGLQGDREQEGKTVLCSDGAKTARKLAVGFAGLWVSASMVSRPGNGRQWPGVELAKIQFSNGMGMEVRGMLGKEGIEVAKKACVTGIMQAGRDPKWP